VKIAVRFLFAVFLSVLYVHDVMAWANCTQDVPAGKFCKTAGVKYDCRPGCYCTGSKKAVGTSIDVEASCLERKNEASLNASGIYFCPQGRWSNSGAKSIDDCYVETYGNGQNTLKCPSGCFCLNNGYFQDFDYGPGDCAQSASLRSLSCNNDGTAILSYYGGSTTFVCDRNKYFQNHPNSNSGLLYFLDDFSEIYTGWISAYGVKKDGNIIYFHSGSSSMVMDNIYQCPESYPASDEGAKTLTNCYKYGANGNKIYYRPSNNTNNSGNSNNNTNNGSSGGSGNTNDTTSDGSTTTKTPSVNYNANNNANTTNANNNTNNNNTNIISGNSDVASVQILVRNLQQALNKTMQDLQNLENQSNNKPVSMVAVNTALKTKAAVPQRTKKSLTVPPVKKIQSRSAISKQSVLPSVEPVSVEPVFVEPAHVEPVRSAQKIKRPSKYEERNKK